MWDSIRDLRVPIGEDGSRVFGNLQKHKFYILTEF